MIIPSLLAERAKQDAWLAAIVATACGLLLVCLYNALGSRYPDLNLAEYSERVFGKWIGKTVSLLFLLVLPWCCPPSSSKISGFLSRLR